MRTMANKLTPEEAEVIVEWPDGQVIRGRMLAIDPAKVGFATEEWLGGPLREHMRARGLSEAEREAMCAQVAAAESEFQACMSRTSPPRAPGIPRVVIRAVRGWDGDQQVAWLSRDEVADRMRTLAQGIATEAARLMAAGPTPEERGAMSARLARYAERLRTDAGQVTALSLSDYRSL